MNITMIPYEAWQQLKEQYPEASQFLYVASLQEEIRHNEARARLTTNAEFEKEIVQKNFNLREKLKAAVSSIESELLK